MNIEQHDYDDNLTHVIFLLTQKLSSLRKLLHSFSHFLASTQSLELHGHVADAYKLNQGDI